MTGPAGWPAVVVMLGVAWMLAFGSPARAAATPPDRFPAAGELLRAAAVRARPDPTAEVVRRLRRFRPDHQFQIVLASLVPRGRDGAWWYRLSLPGRPNGARGWVRADAVEVRAVVNRIVVRLAERRLEVRRVRDGTALAPGDRRGRCAGRGDAARTELLRGVRLRSDRSVLRRLRPRDERLRARHGLAEQRRRNPRHEPAGPPRPGGLARAASASPTASRIGFDG